MKACYTKKKILNLIKKNYTLLIATLSFISFILTVIFKAFFYLFYRGYYDYFSIPSSYIEIDYSSILSTFITSMTCFLIYFGISLIYWYNLLKFKHIKKLVIRVLYVSLMLLLIPIVLIIILVLLIVGYEQCSLIQVLHYIFLENNLDFWRFVAVVSSISFLITFIIGQGVHLFNKVYNYNPIDNKDSCSKNNSSNLIYKIVTCTVIFFACIAYLGYSIYDSGRSSIAKQKEIEIVKMRDNEYVIIGKYEDRWILKECVFTTKEGLKINIDHYMIEDITGQDIIANAIPDKKCIGDCMVRDQEYKKIVAENNPKE